MRELDAKLLLFVVFMVILSVSGPENVLHFIGAMFVGTAVIARVAPLLEDDGDEVDAAHAAYVNDEIDEAELERRLDLALDPETERIRAAVTPVNGVGPATAAALHNEFGTLAAVERADVETLAHAHGVGPATAAKIHDRLN